MQEQRIRIHRKPAPVSLPIVDELLARHRDVPGGLMPLLHAVQEAVGYVPAEAVPSIAEGMNLSRAEVHGVITYYHFFRSEKPGRKVVQVCRAESCKSVGADALLAHVESVLGCEVHHTRADGAVSLEPAYCLGLCAVSPSMMVDDRPYARMTPDRFDRLARELGMAA